VITIPDNEDDTESMQEAGVHGNVNDSTAGEVQVELSLKDAGKGFEFTVLFWFLRFNSLCLFAVPIKRKRGRPRSKSGRLWESLAFPCVYTNTRSGFPMVQLWGPSKS